MSNLKLSVGVLSVSVVGPIFLFLTGCGLETSPNGCSASTETRGQAVAKKAVMQFLRYAGKTHAPISGEGGTLDVAKLERISDSDLIYDSRVPTDSSTYQFHLRWSPNAIFTGTVASNCSVTTNWSVK